MGNNLSINKINFEDMKHIQKNENSIIIILWNHIIKTV